MSAQRVCVIGAGAAGLCAARHLSERFQTVVFELSDVVGGTWVYNPEVGKDRHGLPIHSSMYARMRTNLPKEVMAFPDYPFPSYPESFLHHTKVRKYLESYCDEFGVRKLIAFNTKVEHVEPSTRDTGKVEWRVKTKSLDSSQEAQDVFDAVVVCNGHYSVPHRAPIKGIERFEGLLMHSHDYRTPERFRGLNVVVFGAAASGMDIGLEITAEANQVYLSHNNPLLTTRLPSNMAQVRGVTECLTANGLVLSDGSKIQVDALLYCTGYDFSFPFLSPECNVEVKDRQVRPLYKHMLHPDLPSLAFIGIPTQICPFPVFDRQVQWFREILLGNAKLKSPKEMRAETERDKEEQRARGKAERHYHKMGSDQWEYNRDLCRLANVEDIPLEVERLYDDVHHKRKKSLQSYKNDTFVKGEDGTYKFVSSG